MIRIAIDGACKGNGKAECISGSGVFIEHTPVDTEVPIYKQFTHREECSTNQRGELNALAIALEYCFLHSTEDTLIVTDSEYLFNTLTKEWYKGWINRGWLTREGAPVKNKDLWERIVATYEALDIPTMIYHVKGHILPDGGKTTQRILADSPGRLYEYYLKKFDEYEPKKTAQITHLQELSMVNNGFEYRREQLKQFVAMNSTADRIAVSAILDK